MLFLLFFIFPTIYSDDVIPSVAPIFVPKREFTKTDELLLVQTIWRHGDRAPVLTYPTDVHQEESWPNGWGELTQLGMRQQFALGRVIRRRYINGTYNFLSPRYNSKEIFIRSTDVNRTLISAYSNLAGMFTNGEPGTDYPSYFKWPSDWTPVPVHTIDLNTDYPGNVFAPCERAVELDEELRSSEEYLKIVVDNQDFLDYISNMTGMKVELPTLYLINDVSHIENIYNMSQPAWLTEEVAERMRNLTRLANEYTYGIGKPYVPEMIKLRGGIVHNKKKTAVRGVVKGSMLKDVMDRLKLKLSCYQVNNDGEHCSWIRNIKYHAYSAHDTTVAALLTTLGDEERVIRGGLPKYTASVAFELWNLHDVGPAVRILFHGAFHHNYHTITHLTKGCPTDNEFCPLKTFERRSLKFVPKDIRADCQPKKSSMTNRTDRL